MHKADAANSQPVEEIDNIRKILFGDQVAQIEDIRSKIDVKPSRTISTSCAAKTAICARLWKPK